MSADSDKPTFSCGIGFRSDVGDRRTGRAAGLRGASLLAAGPLLRTGPSKFEVGARSYNHWFDGLAMLHSFAFADGGVPWPSRQTEHDGVLLSIVLDIERGRSFLLVLHPASLNELARAEAPHAIPLHFHGNYFPGAA